MEKVVKTVKKADVTWAQKVLALVKLSDDGKVGLFGDYAIKQYKKAIRTNCTLRSSYCEKLVNNLTLQKKL